MIHKIEDFNAPELDIYARLSEAELLHLFEPDGGVFIAESPKVIERALDASYEPISFLIEEGDIEKEGAHIIERCPDIPVYTARFDVLTNLTGYKLTRGMLAAFRRKPYEKTEDVCAGAKRIAVLDQVMNPTNVGAIMRSAAALNIDALLLTEGCSNPLYRRAIRVSMGTVFQIKWTFIDGVSWKDEGVNYLKKLGFKTAAMALKKDTVDIDDEGLNKEERLAIILGTEGDGLSDFVIDNCDYTIKIPMSNNVDSLNVAAASAVAFWQLGNKV